MKNEYRVLCYKEYIKRIIVLCLLVWIIPIVYILTKETNESFYWGYIIFALAFSIITPIVLCIFRKIFIGILGAFQLEFKTVYELEKRKKDDIYNLKLLMNMYFFNGEFENVIYCSDKVLQLSYKDEDVYIARHQKILALFLTDKNTEISTLIEQQRQLIKKSSRIAGDSNLYYIYIEKYIKGFYEEAIQTIYKALENKNIEVQNYKKVLIFHLMKLCYSKMGESNYVQNCINEILNADKNRKTFFAKFKLSENTGDRF